MADNSNNMNSNMCKSNCGFFGNASCDGFCSKCYKDHVKRQNSGSAAGRVTPTSMSVASSANSSSSMAAAATAAALTQMNSINEIPVNTKSSSFNNSITTSISEDDYPAEQQQSTQASHESGKMLPPLAPPPVSSSDAAITPNSNSSIASIGSAASKPIAIPGRAFSTNAANVAMSVPADLCSTSMTSTSPTDTNADDSLLGTSIESSSLNVISMSCSNAGEVKSKKRSRCVLDSCKRKVGLTGFDCRCGGLYCWEHRYSDKHNCQFDYKELGQDQIRKNNPIVVGEKIQKIQGKQGTPDARHRTGR